MLGNDKVQLNTVLNIHNECATPMYLQISNCRRSNIYQMDSLGQLDTILDKCRDKECGTNVSCVH
jgi:hypothetical protein